MRILITGACGFWGHHFVNHLLKNTDFDIIVLDKLSYASSGFDRLRDIDCYDDKRVLKLTTDFTKPIEPGIAQEIGSVDYIVHAGAETHVDKSIENPEPFVISNVVGTMHMLNFAKTLPNLKMFVQFSTDEVYGPAPEGYNFKEDARYNCTNPYAASKAGAEQLAMAYANTYKLPVIVTNTMNLYGARQSPEKFIPMTMRKVWLGEEVIIHANKDLTKAGSRFYIHCRNAAAAILFLLENGKFRERYNVVGEKEVDNLQVAQLIADILGKPLKYRMTDFHSERPGHDLRYGLDGAKLKEMGFNFPKTFEDSFRENVEWHFKLENRRWLNI
jgi:dTDP-glucose 4,6-dehydratase